MERAVDLAQTLAQAYTANEPWLIDVRMDRAGRSSTKANVKFRCKRRPSSEHRRALPAVAWFVF